MPRSLVLVAVALLLGLLTLAGARSSYVHVTVHTALGSPPNPAVQELLATGNVRHHSARHGVTRAHVSKDVARQLAALPGVRSVRPVLPPDVRATVNEANAALGVTALRATYGVNATGIRVGVISDSASSASVAAAKASGDLPSVVNVLSAGTGTDEGTAMMVLVHALAPGAVLYFHDCGASETEMASAIDALVAAGCDVIAEDIGWADEAPLHLFGPLYDSIAVATAAGVHYVSAAGNGGAVDAGTSTTWEGPFVPSSTTVPGLGVLASFGGQAYLQLLGPETPLAIVLWWADPIGASNSDADVYLMNEHNATVAFSDNPQTGTQDPIEVITNIPTLHFGAHTYHIWIANYSMSASRFLRVQLFGCNFCSITPATAGATYGHAAGNHTIGVAAVDVSTCAGNCFGKTLSAETYSSDGPRAVFYGPSGTIPLVANLSGPGILLRKPDVAGLDRVSTAVPGFTVLAGTSCAAPHIAALLALIRSAAPTASRADVLTALTASTIPVSTAADAGAGIPWVAPVFAALRTCGNGTSGHYTVPTNLSCAACPIFGQSGTLGSSTCVTLGVPTTPAPTTATPTTRAPTTPAPTTRAPATPAPTTRAPTTAAPTSLAPTTHAPTTLAPTTSAPTTAAPSSAAVTTVSVLGFALLAGMGCMLVIL